MLIERLGIKMLRKQKCTSALCQLAAQTTPEISPKKVEFVAGQTIPLMIKNQEGLYCLCRGAVKLMSNHFGESRALHIIIDGELFGFENWNQSGQTSAVALVDGEACFYDRKTFEKLVIANEKNRDQFSFLLKTLSTAHFRLWSLEGRTVRARIAGTLLSLIGYNKKKAPHSSYVPTVDRKTLAELSSTVVETLSRILARFEKDGLVERNGRAIRIVDPNALAELTKD